MMPYYRGRVLQLPNVRRDILQENGKLLLMIDITFVFVWYVSGNSVNFCSVGSEEIHTIVLAWYRINVIWFQTYVKLAWNSHHMISDSRSSSCSCCQFKISFNPYHLKCPSKLTKSKLIELRVLWEI